MLPHPHVQSPVTGSHVDAQLFLRREALPLPAAFSQQKIENFTKHGGFLLRLFLPRYLGFFLFPMFFGNCREKEYPKRCADHQPSNPQPIRDQSGSKRIYNSQKQDCQKEHDHNGCPKGFEKLRRFLLHFPVLLNLQTILLCILSNKRGFLSMAWV